MRLCWFVEPIWQHRQYCALFPRCLLRPQTYSSQSLGWSRSALQRQWRSRSAGRIYHPEQRVRHLRVQHYLAITKQTQKVFARMKHALDPSEAQEAAAPLMLWIRLHVNGTTPELTLSRTNLALPIAPLRTFFSACSLSSETGAAVLISDAASGIRPGGLPGVPKGACLARQRCRAHSIVHSPAHCPEQAFLIQPPAGLFHLL